MTSFLLSLGCTLIAFSPSLTLLFLFTYSKAQLIIVVTTSAFCFLLSSLFSSILNLPFTLLNLEKWNAFVVIPISVLCQSGMRCMFVKLYRRVEEVIEKSIRVHEEEEEERKEMEQRRNVNNNVEGKQQEGEEDDDDDDTANHNNTSIITSESALLRLELNDLSCSIAAGVGFGGMHTVLLYGTLLASEGGRMGTLYQPSCSFMPSLINSAFMAFWFAVLDIVWMMIAFYGVRVWESNLLYKQSQALSHQQQQQQEQNQPIFFTAYGHGAAIINEWSFAKGRVSGKAALLFMLISHLLASLTTTMNVIIPVNGCIIALPLLSIVSVAILVTSWIFLKDNFLPEMQKQRIRVANHLD